MKKKFITGTMLIVALALSISAAAGVWSLDRQETSAARESLRELLELIDAGDIPPARALEAFRTAIPDKRLTLIAPDGSVLADTDSDTTENHLARPEVREALETGWGEDVRTSDTLGAPMLYVAKALSDGTVGRAAMPLSFIDAFVADGLPPLVLAALAALILSLALSGRAAKILVGPLAAVDLSLREVLSGRASAGDLREYDGGEELRPLLRSIGELMERLTSHMEQLQAERDKVSLILDCMDEGFLLLDEEGDILSVNRAARELFGLPDGEHGGAQLLLRSRRVRRALETARRERAPVVLDLDDPALEGRELRLFLSPVAGRQYEGQNVGTSVLVSDVTELKKAENVRSEFTANVSHELKTPLTSIRGSCEMLSKGMIAPEDYPQFFTLISVEADRLISLINDILKLSELESVTIQEPCGAASPLEAAKEAAQLLTAEAGQKRIAVLARGEDGAARIPAERLKELLLNLMENAIRYGKEGGCVEVTVSRDGGSMVVQVADDGIGIPEQAQPHVFERFYRVDRSRSRQNGGTGLGLAIVKHICQLYGGSVALKSVPGEGSVFTVTLPAAG